MICLVFFAFTTILGWDYYGERCLEYLTGKDEKKIKIYRWLYILCLLYTSSVEIEQANEGELL